MSHLGTRKSTLGGNPLWRAQDSAALARTVSGVCNIRQEVADRIVAEMLESGSKTAQFETQTFLTGKPVLSRTRTIWVARQVSRSGAVGKRADYELERKARTEG